MREQIVGSFVSDLQPSLEGLSLVMSPATASRTRRWRNNGISADFMGDYVATFFPGAAEDEGSGVREGVKNMVSYVANELLENAIKYHDVAVDHPISIRLLMRSDMLLFIVCNAVSAEQGERYGAVARELAGGDVAEYYARKLETAGPHSGVGLASLIADYAAQIGWKFEAVPPGLCVVTTTVGIPV